jgi:hypothetical protein
MDPPAHQPIKDKGFDAIKENGILKIFTQFVIPIFLVYMLYVNRSNKQLFSTLLKYLLVILVLSLLFKWLKREPDPSNPSKPNTQISVTYAFVILCLLIARDSDVFTFGDVKLFGKQYAYGTLLSLVLIVSYGVGLVAGRVHYTKDVVNTFLLTYLLYSSDIFVRDNTLTIPTQPTQLPPPYPVSDKLKDFDISSKGSTPRL